MAKRKKIEKIGVVTSGGDVPGLNAVIHAIVVAAYKKDIKVIGINNGYDGMIDSIYTPLELGAVRSIMDEGGTMLRTSRCMRFTEKKWRRKAYENLTRHEIDGLIIIGGNGSLTGASVFASEFDMPVIGIPKTIDNDVYGTDFAIGFDTAINTIVTSIDKIRDTADSTSRVFIVEVMGRKAGFLGLHGGIAGGAEVIIIPEIPTETEKMLSYLEHLWHNGNHAMILVITENALPGGGFGLKKMLDDRFPYFDSRLTILGHIQRGGNPTAFDRTLASLLGYNGFKALLKGKSGVMVGQINGKVLFTDLPMVALKNHAIDPQVLEIATNLSFV
ncbi:MAG TPA: ATP-dependent 6-phosphofructokinase [Chitinophagales bacterium]|nr:ATP-dependent 6-phosphofructokinase [Chitinophagales bacterium]